MKTEISSNNFKSAVFACLCGAITLVACLFVFGASPAYANADGGDDSLQAAALNAQDEEGDVAHSEYGLIDKDGFLRPADEDGVKLADVWQTHGIDLHKKDDIVKLFIAADATKVPTKYKFLSQDSSVAREVFVSFRNVTSVVFLLDSTGKNACTTIESGAFSNSAVTSVVNLEKTQLTTIAESAFNNTKLTSLTIPSTLTGIRANAFKGAETIALDLSKTKLKSIGVSAFGGSRIASVTLPDTCTNIGASAFEDCNKLKSFKAGKGLKRIGEEAFYGCAALKTASISGNSVRIDGYAFAKCKNLTTVNFGKTASIGVHAFDGDAKLTKAALPYCAKIADDAFSWCMALKGVSIGKKIKVIGENAFLGCYGLTTVKLKAAKSSLKIEDCAFSGCKNLTSFPFQTIKGEIGIKAFYKCAKLKSVALSDFVKYVGKGAFAGCANLKSFTGGKKLTTFSESVFANCKSLSKMKLKGKARFWYNALNKTPLSKGKGTLYVPKSLVSYYKNLCYENTMERVLPSKCVKGY